MTPPENNSSERDSRWLESDFAACDEDSGARGRGDEVGEFAVVGEFVDDEVGLLPCFERADLGSETEAVGRVDGGGRERFGGREAHLETGQREHERHGWDRRGAGVEVGGEDDGEAGFDHFARGRVLRAAEGEDGAGEQDGLNAGSAEMLESFFGDGFEVVGSRGSEFGGEVGAGAGTKLLGVDAEF